MTVKDDLTDIHGIGEAKADEIVEVVESHGIGIDGDEIERLTRAARRGNEGQVIDFLDSLSE